MEIRSYLLPEQPAENEVLVTQHLLLLSVSVGESTEVPPLFPIAEVFTAFLGPDLPCNHPTAVPAQGHRGQAQHPHGQPSHDSRGASSAGHTGMASRHHEGQPGRPIPGMGFVPVPDLPGECFRAGQLPGPVHRAAKRSLCHRQLLVCT